MATYTDKKYADKKSEIRQQIILAAGIYKDKLAGRVFLYVYGDSYFEVAFPTNGFRHLTGVNSKINAQKFYEKAVDATLTVDQFDFDRNHLIKNTNKKLPYLLLLPRLTTELVCVLKDMKTLTITYKIGVTNLEFTMGLTANNDMNGNKINDWYVPRTLRGKDKALEDSADAEFIDFIFCKEASLLEYNTLTFSTEVKTPPQIIKPMLTQELVDSLYTN